MDSAGYTGVEPGTRVAKMAEQHLKRAGLKGLRYVAPGDTLPEYLLVFGASARKELLKYASQDLDNSSEGRGKPLLDAGRGKLYPLPGRKVMFCTIAPGSLIRRKSLLPLFKNDLDDFKLILEVDGAGI